MKIYNEIETLDLCLYLNEYKTLVISDLHLGYEESLNKRGVLVPRIQFNEIYEKLKNILINKDMETIIITGDLKHEFGVINNSEWKNIIQIIDLFLKHCKRLIIIKGNHDITLPFITRKKGIEVLEYFKFDEIFICHGDEIINNEDFRKSKVVIIGHEHPAIGFRDKNKYETYKCFLKGKFLDKVLIVLPSFNPLTVGTDVLRNRLLSPFLQQNLSNFSFYVTEKDKIYDFGKLKNLPS